MRNLKNQQLQNLQGGICTKPVNAQANFCLPCAALIGSGNMMHAGGLVFCPL